MANPSRGGFFTRQKSLSLDPRLFNRRSGLISKSNLDIASSLTLEERIIQLTSNLKRSEDKFRELLLKYDQLSNENQELKNKISKMNLSSIRSSSVRGDTTPTKITKIIRFTFPPSSPIDFGEKQKIPRIILECVTLLESNESFMKEKGLYRISGDHSIIQELKNQLQIENYTEIQNHQSPHEITGVLKGFVRDMKTPLVSKQILYQAIPQWELFLKDSVENQIATIQNMVKLLSSDSYGVLQYLIKHFQKVTSYVEFNEMTAEHLSIVVGSCVFPELFADLPGAGTNIIIVTQLPNFIAKLMIENFEAIFGMR